MYGLLLFDLKVVKIFRMKHVKKSKALLIKKEQ